MTRVATDIAAAGGTASGCEVDVADADRVRLMVGGASFITGSHHLVDGGYTAR